jgi:hypothetical protein
MPIGTEYARAALLPTESRVSELLRRYTCTFHFTKPAMSVRSIRLTTPLNCRPRFGPLSCMRQRRSPRPQTQAAWWNRIPASAWGLMGLIAISCNLLVGYGERRSSALVLLTLPPIVSVAFFLIADIDSPRVSIIRVLPQNLIAVSQAMMAE